MTSTTLSSKDFKTMLKWAFLRNRGIMIVFSILIGFAVIGNCYLMVVNEYDGFTDDALLASMIILAVGAAFFVFVSSLNTYSYLHNKRSVDMYGALPTTRTKTFLSHLIAGVVSVAVPYTAGSIIIVGMYARSTDNFKLSIYLILTTYLMIIASYAFTALIAYCCGTVLDTAIVTIAINVMWLSVMMMYFGMAGDIIPGVVMESMLETPLFFILSPYSFCFVDLYYYLEGTLFTQALFILIQILLTVGYFVLALMAANKRRSECSQNGFAFNWIPIIVKSGVAVAIGMITGYMSASISENGYANMLVYVFWYVIAAVVSFTILHIIFSRTAKTSLAKSVIVFASASVVSLVLVFAMTFGLGADTYVPSPSSIKSVEFDGVTYTDPKNIETVTEIHKLITANIRDNNDYPYYFGCEPYWGYEEVDYSDDILYNTEDSTYSSTAASTVSNNKYELVNSCNFEINYKRKVGFAVRRSYYLYVPSSIDKMYDYDSMEKLLRTLHNSDEYKKIMFDFLWDRELLNDRTPNGCKLEHYVATNNSVYGNEYASVGYRYMVADEKFAEGFYDAFMKDLIADNNFADYFLIDEYGDEYYAVTIDYTLTKPKYSWQEEDAKYFTVNPSYTNTIAYLTDNHLMERSNGGLINVEDYSYYHSFCYSGVRAGSLEVLLNFTKEMEEDFACAGFYNWHDNSISYSEWHSKYIDDYKSALEELAEVYYNDMIDDYKPSNNDSIDIENSPYSELCKAIVGKLEDFTKDYMENKLYRLSDTDTDTDTNASTDVKDNEDSSTSKPEASAER